MSRPSSTRDRFEDYVPVAERLEKFYAAYPEGRVLTVIIEHDREAGFILMRAEVYRNADDAHRRPRATPSRCAAKVMCRRRAMWRCAKRVVWAVH